MVLQFFTVTCHALVMCGRVRSTLGADQVAADVPWVNREQYTPRYNASPGASLAVLRVACPGETSSSGRVVETMRFGLVPSYTDKAAKVDFYRMFNARSETIAEKGVFSRLLQRRRGVVLLNGFYEWAMEKAGASQVKQPYYLHLDGGGGESEGDVLRCAALYDRWKGGDGGELVTVTIITVTASKPLRWLHDRMPAVLRTETDVAAWLEGSHDDHSSVLKPYGETDMKWYPVSTKINKGDFEDPSCCERTKRVAQKDAGDVVKLFSAAANKRGDSPVKRDSPAEGKDDTVGEKRLGETTPTNVQPGGVKRAKPSPGAGGAQRSLHSFFKKS